MRCESATKYSNASVAFCCIRTRPLQVADIKAFPPNLPAIASPLAWLPLGVHEVSCGKPPSHVIFNKRSHISIRRLAFPPQLPFPTCSFFLVVMINFQIMFSFTSHHICISIRRFSFPASARANATDVLQPCVALRWTKSVPLSATICKYLGIVSALRKSAYLLPLLSL